MKQNFWTRWVATILCIILFVQAVPSYALELERVDGVIQAEQATLKVPTMELTDKRSEYTKHFRMSDGTFQMISSAVPLHYEKDGVWEEIDTTLIESDGRAVPAASPFNVSFGLKSTDTLVTLKDRETGSLFSFDLLEKKNASVQADWAATSSIPSKSNAATARTSAETDPVQKIGQNLANKMTYGNILANTDLTYEMTPYTLKESVIINRPGKEYVYRFSISGTDYRLALEEDQSISVYRKADDSLAYVIAAPFMFDQNQAESTQIDVSLSEGEGNWIMTLRPDAAWLNDPDRAFPVTLDPTVTFPETLSRFKMARYSSPSNTVLHSIPTGASSEATLSAAIYRYNSEIRSLYLKFDLASLDYETTNNDYELTKPLFGSTIVDAELRFYGHQTGSYIMSSFELYRNTSTWYNNFTASNRPNSAAVMEALVKPVSSGGVAIDYSSVGNGTYWYTADITAMVRDWYNDPTSNHGVQIKPIAPANSKVYACDVYCEVRNLLTEKGEKDIMAMPTLSVNYVSNSGLENYWTYQSEALDTADFYVNHRTGALTAVFEDISTNNQRNGISVSHVYNDTLAYNGQTGNYGAIVGNGFMLNIQETLSLRTDQYEQDYYIHMDEDGTYHYYTWNESRSRYEKETDPDSYIDPNSTTIHFKDKSTKKFTNEQLSAYTDSNGNRIEIVLEQFADSCLPVRIKEILNGSTTRDTVLTWESLPENDFDYHLVSIRSPEGEYVQYTYDETGEVLTGVKWNRQQTYSGGSSGSGANQTLTLAYDADGLLKTAVDGWTGDRLTVTRSNQKVADLKKYVRLLNSQNGSYTSVKMVELDFSYTNVTAVADQINTVSGKPYTMTYRFDQYGKTISVTDSLDNSKYYEFGAEGGAKNKITLESKLIQKSANRLRDPFFQQGISSVWKASGTATTMTISGFYGKAARLAPGASVYQSFTVDERDTYCISAKLSGDKENFVFQIYNGSTYQDLETDLYDERAIAHANLRAGGGLYALL